MSTTSISKKSKSEEASFTKTTVINGSHGSEESEGKKISHSDNSYLESKIRQLEADKFSISNDKKTLEEQLKLEKRKVHNLSEILKNFKIENDESFKTKITFEEKYSIQQQQYTRLEVNYKELEHNNSYLLKKVKALEEALSTEKRLHEIISEKFFSSQTYIKSLLVKVSTFKETIKIHQHKIFELESEILVSSTSSETMLKHVSDYERNIKHLRLQMESLAKKLEISCADNEFLVEKLSMLTKSLRTYQSQIDCLTSKLQSSKVVIGSAHAELSRSNTQVSKYQAALSSCYFLNGELMTKLSSTNLLAQNQVGGDCSLNLISYSSDIGFGKKGSKSSSFIETAKLFEITDESFSKAKFSEEVYGETWKETKVVNGESEVAHFE